MNAVVQLEFWQRAIKKNQYFWIERDEKSTVEKTLYMAEQDFGLK